MKKLIVIIILLAVIGWVLHKLGWLPIGQQQPETPPTTSSITTPQTPSSSPTDGITLFEAGKYKNAIKELEKEILQGRVKDIAQHLSYIAAAYERIEKPDKAHETWQKILSEHPKSPYCGDAYYGIGKTLPDPAQRIEYFEKAVANFPTSAGAKAASYELGETYLTSNLPDKEFKARRCLSLALKSNLPEEKKQEIKQKLAELNKKLIFSKMPTPDSAIYLVKSGDTIASISEKYKAEPGGEIAIGHIRRVNQLKTDWIYPNDKLKIITGKFHIEINKSIFTLTLYLNDAFVKEYSISIGKAGSDTPTGIFHIIGKVPHPPWTVRYEDGRSEIIPYSDPRNILGTRWMGFKESPRVGIHGTTQPESIGQKITDGCVRMFNDDVEEIYDLIAEGTEVFIFD